ncbi:uncharacterized protein LOC34617793 [Cyclospora cayetanensis]|uniref:Uncharacterized protein LOC34617793 n=1 Tax=Cyclospora cayetanensis TaxID=88456 RepID=A0A6P6RXI1_9EIME|nr:uncharacterized protein LOC34617793 [Cyclospora cayetanensis]
MGTSQSKQYKSSNGHRERRLCPLHDSRSRRQTPGTEPWGGSDRSSGKHRKGVSGVRKINLGRFRQAWAFHRGRTHASGFHDEDHVEKTVAMPWFGKSQNQGPFLTPREPVKDDLSSSRNVVATNASEYFSVVKASEHSDASDKFIARPWQAWACSRMGGPLCRSFANLLQYMNEDVIEGLSHHPCPNEGLALMYTNCFHVPLPVEPTLEPSPNALGYLFPGTYFKVLDVRACITQASYLLRLKTLEGWVTGASLQLLQPPPDPRVRSWRPANEEAITKSTQRSPAVVVAAGGSRGDSAPPHLQGKLDSVLNSFQTLNASEGTADDFSEFEEGPLPCFAVVYACRATRSRSFQECIILSEERESYRSLSRLAKVSTLQRFEEALQEASPHIFLKAGEMPGPKASWDGSARSMPLDEVVAANSVSSQSRGLRPMQHPFILYRVRAAGPVAVSATPHLGSLTVGRLLRGQVFPVLDVCLVCCVPACGRLAGENGCVIAGWEFSGSEGSDSTQAGPSVGLRDRESKRSLCRLTRRRRVHVRACTVEGWVTLDRLTERVDECEIVYSSPRLYEIVADGYLVNVRPSLEIEGLVRRTLPPATLVEVFERKINREGLVRLRLADGWINERRKGSGDGGFFFARPVMDRRADNFLRQITAVGVLLPALCSVHSRVRTLAATWVAANATQSAIGSAAFMEEVDITLLEEALVRCSCCHCKRYDQGDGEGQGVESSGCHYSYHQHDRDDHLASFGETTPSFPTTSAIPPSESKLKGDADGTGERQNASCQCSTTSPTAPCGCIAMAAKDLPFTESPVTTSPTPRASASTSSAPRTAAEVTGNSYDSMAFVVGVTTPLMRSDECSRGQCHRGRCCLEGDVESMAEISDSDLKGTDNHQKHGRLWSSLFSLTRVASTLPSGLASFHCLHCSHTENSAQEPGANEADDEEHASTVFENCRVLCQRPDCDASIGSPGEQCSREKLRNATRSLQRSSVSVDSLRTCATTVPSTSLDYCQSRAFSLIPSPELGMGLGSNHDLQACRISLSPSDTLYQFCVAAVYSSLAEHREPVPPYTVYRPPLGSFVAPLDPDNTMTLEGSSCNKNLLHMYMPYLNLKEGKLSLGNPSRYSSFSFHQPPIIVACLNEYFLFHGCTEERAKLIALSGFDFRRGGENGGKLFGIGTYFSPFASKADLYTRLNDSASRSVGPGPLMPIALHNLPSLTPLPVHLARPAKGAPGGSPAVPGIPGQMVATMGGPSAVLSDPNATRSTAVSLRLLKGSWVGGGKGGGSGPPLMPASSASHSTQPEGAIKKEKETGLRAVCTKFARQNNGRSNSQSKAGVVPGQKGGTSTVATTQPTNSHQQARAPDAAGGANRHAKGSAVRASSSNSSTRPPLRCLLLARVCLGEVYKALGPISDARMPPLKAHPVSSKLTYDSVMAECRTRGGIVDGVEFVVFERAQALPEFIITYSHASQCQCAECHRQLTQ